MLLYVIDHEKRVIQQNNNFLTLFRISIHKVYSKMLKIHHT